MALDFKQKVGVIGAFNGYLVWWSQGKLAELIYDIFLKHFIDDPVGIWALAGYVVANALLFYVLGMIAEKWL